MEQENNNASMGGGVVQNSQNSQNPSGGHKTLWGVLSYLGPLVIVSLLVGRGDPFVKFHVKQGLVLFAICVIVWFLGMNMMWYSMAMVYNLVNLATFILSIIGIVNVVQGKEKELPLVGGLGKYFPV